MDDTVNRPKEDREKPAVPKRGGCLRRVLIGSLLLIAVLFCAFLWFTHRTRSNPPFSTALELIQNDSHMIEHLGEPIQNVRWLPSGNYPSQFQIQVKGPNAVADVSVSARQFDGKWEVTALDARVFDPSKPHETAESLSIDIGSGEGDAPTWSGGSSTETEKPDDLGLQPPSGIEMQLPVGGPPGVEIQLPEMPPAPES